MTAKVFGVFFGYVVRVHVSSDVLRNNFGGYFVYLFNVDTIYFRFEGGYGFGFDIGLVVRCTWVLNGVRFDFPFASCGLANNFL